MRRRGTPLLRGAFTARRTADAPVQISVRTASLADQLLQLGQQRQQGLLTQEEYTAAKTDLLT